MAFPSGKQTTFIERIKARLALTGDSEPEQAIHARLTISIILLICFVVPWDTHETLSSSLSTHLSQTLLIHFSGALFLVTMIFIDPSPSVVRKVCGMFLDLGCLSVVMFEAGGESIFLFMFYLWVILGNGFRFGAPYLYVSQTIGIIGFFTAVTWGEYWQQSEYQSIGYSLLLLIMAIPLYAVFLIKKLHTALDAAKLANEAKTRFLANMSHELRTPLNGVIGVADLLEETKLAGSQRELVSMMRSSANTLLSLIENVLDISKIEAGKVIIKHEHFDLHQLIASIMQMQTTMGRAKGLHVSCSIDAAISYSVKGDADHLRQVLINLLGNAIKFTDKGSVKLLLTHVGSKDNITTVRFVIEDTGIGIPEEALNTIFDDFTQVSTKNQVKYQGTGLGTTISKQLVELMGGEIGVESKVNHGSQFWFELSFDTVSEKSLKLNTEKVLILANQECADTIGMHLQSWSVGYDFVINLAQALNMLMASAESDTPYTIMLIEQSTMLDIDPVKFARIIFTEHTLENLSLILLNHQQPVATHAELNSYYISSVADMNDKRSLFNALHAAQPVYHRDDKVVRLADRYSGETFRPLHILIAEDNVVNQRVLQGILHNLGHKVHLASTGESALDILTNQVDEFDLLILDMNMPGYSGTEILKAQKFISHQSIPVIMLTADATPEAEQQALEAGANAYLTKPIHSKTLVDEIIRLTTNTASMAEPEQVKSNSDTDNSWLDHQLIEELKQLGGGTDFFSTLIEGFKTDAEKHLVILNTAVKDDYLRFRESLHALKGSATEIGAVQLAKLCRQGEQMQPEQINSTDMYKLLDNITSTYQQSLSLLTESIKSSSQTPH